jgi:hypothetical protein
MSRKRYPSDDKRKAAEYRRRGQLARVFLEDLPRLNEVDRPRDPESIPTPEKIRQACGQIQKEWSPRERAKRAGIFGRQTVWLPPVVPVPENFD